MKIRFLLALLLIFGLVVSACAKTTPPPATSAPPAAPPAKEEGEGKAIYAQKCAACHGANGEGTAAAPSVAGHSMGALKTQVRNPVGTMPAFPASQLSDHDLDELAEFIAAMGMAKAPMMEWEKATTESMHLWMALLAIKSEDSRDARHHLQDVLTFIKDPKHKEATEAALRLIDQGKPHDAEHEIEEIVGSESPSGVSMKRFHLILAQRGVEAENATEVKHHLTGHFLTLATDAEKKIAGEAVELAEKGDFHETEHEVEELLAK